MKEEIRSALDILTCYIQRFGSINDDSLDVFRSKLEQVLLERYQGHWYPGKRER